MDLRATVCRRHGDVGYGSIIVDCTSERTAKACPLFLLTRFLEKERGSPGHLKREWYRQALRSSQFHCGNKGKISVTLTIVQSIANEKLVGYIEANVIQRNIGQAQV